jgi:leucyl aminopeptidase (aminopeptidase T)
MRSCMELARQIVEVCLNVGYGENVWIQSWDHTVDIASELAFACLQRGAHDQSHRSHRWTTYTKGCYTNLLIT